MNNLTTRASRLRKQLIADPAHYIEAIGKHDNSALENILTSTDGTDTIVRLVMGATTVMPTRALTYVAAAAQVVQTVAAEQLQVVFATTIGEEVNRIPKSTSDVQATLLSRFGAHLLGHLMPDIAAKTVFAKDTLLPKTASIVPYVRAALEHTPDITHKLVPKAAKRDGDFYQYVAAHVMYHDTPDLVLDVIDGPPAISPKRIISVGGQSEKVFYAARTAVRELLNPADRIPGIQIFTRHVYPPYFICDGGEQTLEDAVATRSIQFTAGNPAAERDLRHFQELLSGQGAPHVEK